ncbi:MAG TPA: DUF5684 domain-containing protein [Vicinamibacteria bacterium]|nr:DUF5684 domain-containing protein [Vicinamibacteria bacterium]
MLALALTLGVPVLSLAMAGQELEGSGGGGGGIVGLLFMAVWLGLTALVIAGFWKTFVKAGEPGWAILVPIYNVIVLLKIAGKPAWWFLLFLVPLVNLVIGIMVAVEIAGNFGKGTGFGVGLALLPFVFYPMLGFGDAVYQGAGAVPRRAAA